jgi:hypothetical protein
VLVAIPVFTVWGRPPKTGSGSATFGFRFLHRIVGGVFNYGASAYAGAGLRSGPSWSVPGNGQCQNPPLTRRSTGRQKRGAFGSLRYRSGAGYLSVNGQALVSFWLVLCKGLDIRLAAKPAHSGDRQGRKLRRPVWLPKRSAELVLLVCPSRGAVRLKRSSGRKLLRSGSFRHPSSWCNLSGKGHAALGVGLNHGGERPLTRQLNSFRSSASTGRPCRAAVYCWR